MRNGSISNFAFGVGLSSADGSIVEGLRVFSGVGQPLCGFCVTGIAANGIVRGNTVVGFFGSPPIIGGVGISATGIVTGNYVTGSRRAGMQIGQGSTVIGNTATNTEGPDIEVTCPSNVTDNTTVRFGDVGVIVLSGAGCNTTNNVGNVIGP